MNFILFFFLIFELLCILYICKIFLCFKTNQDNIFYEDICCAKILVIIPAHNESIQIRDTIRSIKKVNYPNNLIDIILLNDKCIDNTVNIARAEKIDIYNFNNNTNTKGGILNDFCLQYKSLINKYDYLCIIDADTLVDPNFFIAANNELKNKHKIVQGEITSIKYNENCVSCFMELFQLIINFYTNYQSKLNKSVMTGGKGLLISPKVLEKIKWDDNILIEDIDFSLNALINGYSIYYCPQMKVKTKQVYTFRDMWIQQRRYASGQKQIFQKYYRFLISNKLVGVARTYIIQGCLSFILFLLMSISLFNLKIFLNIILSVYICIAIIVALIIKTLNTNYSFSKIILYFPFMLFYWHIIYTISFFKPENCWKYVRNKY